MDTYLQRNFRIFALMLTCISLTANALGRPAADPQLLAEIRSIRAIDNHSHALAVTASGETDNAADVIPCGSFEYSAPPPMRLRPDNAVYFGAWRELFGYRYDDMLPAHLSELAGARSRIALEKGDAYPAWILDKLNIDVMLTNRVTMGRGLSAPRFRWVGYGDPLLLPFPTSDPSKLNTDTREILRRENELFLKFRNDLGIRSLPQTLDEYLKRVVTPSLVRQKEGGAIAIKFVAAYYRSLNFDAVSRPDAAAVYDKYRRGGAPGAAEYKRFQDHVFRYMLTEIRRLGLKTHIHTGGGCGHFFNLSNANPLLLESVINDPAHQGTPIVLIHGGYPFAESAAFLLEKPGVYADFSAQTFLLSPAGLARVLKSWLEYEPEKILFGTDASPTGPEVGWEESAWLTTNVAREALAIALTQMIREKEITRERASELARMVMRGNAATLYGLGN